MKKARIVILILSAALLAACGEPQSGSQAEPEKKTTISREEYERHRLERLEYYRAHKVEGLQRDEDCKYLTPQDSLENADCSAASTLRLELHSELIQVNTDRMAAGQPPITIDELYPGVKRQESGPIKEIPKFK